MKCIFAFDNQCTSAQTDFFEISTKKYFGNQLRPNKIRIAYKINAPQKSKKVKIPSFMYLFQNLGASTGSLSWNKMKQPKACQTMQRKQV